jgi:hypothetical protein
VPYLASVTNQMTTAEVAKGVNIGESRLMICPGLKCPRYSTAAKYPGKCYVLIRKQKKEDKKPFFYLPFDNIAYPERQAK